MATPERRDRLAELSRAYHERRAAAAAESVGPAVQGLVQPIAAVRGASTPPRRPKSTPGSRTPPPAPVAKRSRTGSAFDEGAAQVVPPAPFEIQAAVCAAREFAERYVLAELCRFHDLDGGPVPRAERERMAEEARENLEEKLRLAFSLDL